MTRDRSAPSWSPTGSPERTGREGAEIPHAVAISLFVIDGPDRATVRSIRSMAFFPVRRVVTGFDPDGREVFTDDGAPPNSVEVGPVGVAEVLWCGSGTVHVGDDPDRTSPGYPLEPPPGGASVRVIRMPGIPPGTDHDDTEVPDPYYGGADGFETVLDLVENGCEGILRKIQAA